MSAEHHQRAATKRPLWTSSVEESCRGCQTPIRIGQKFIRGLTKEPYHKECRRTLHPSIQTRPTIVNSPIRLLPIEDNCFTCGDPIGTEKSVHVQGQPWHKECYLLERRM